jgi:hypothetical protein
MTTTAAPYEKKREKLNTERGRKTSKRNVTEAAHNFGLGQKISLALLQRNAVDDALALDALETGLDHSKVGRIDTQRHL